MFEQTLKGTWRNLLLKAVIAAAFVLYGGLAMVDDLLLILH
jgi:hypothetical protein